MSTIPIAERRLKEMSDALEAARTKAAEALLEVERAAIKHYKAQTVLRILRDAIALRGH